MCEYADKFLFVTLAHLLRQKMTCQQLKYLEEYSSYFGVKITEYLNYLFCDQTVNSRNTKDCEPF